MHSSRVAFSSLQTQQGWKERFSCQCIYLSKVVGWVDGAEGRAVGKVPLLSRRLHRVGFGLWMGWLLWVVLGGGGKGVSGEVLGGGRGAWWMGVRGLEELAEGRRHSWGEGGSVLVDEGEKVVEDIVDGNK